MVPLLAQQPYLGTVYADPRWGMDGSPAPRYGGPEDLHYDRIYHLGYHGWPPLALPFTTHATLAEQWQAADGEVPALDLDRPWITWPKTNALIIPAPLAVGFTDCWFELKAGIVECLKQQPIEGLESAALLTPEGSRWNKELGYDGSGWTQAAQLIRDAKLFLGDCSALHVLAVAMGKQVLCVEPMEARWNSIFYPLGTHDRVRLLRGNDGLPTWDARHCADLLKELLDAHR